MGAVKKAYVSWEDIELDVEKIVAQVSEVDYVVGIPRGGLIIAVMISHKLGIKHMTIDHLEKLEEFGLDIDKKKILVVDDIADTGETLKFYEETFKKSYIVTVHKHEQSIVKPDYSVIDKGDKWIVYPWETEDSEEIQDYLK